jgi:hypothetical protein
MKFLICALLISTAFAESFKIAGDLVEFQTIDGLLVKGCDKKCDALNVIKKHKNINLSKIRKGMKYTNSVGSDVCDKVYKADSVLGVAENTDRRAFCFFKDKSMVEMNSLSAYLVEKKIVK